MILLISRGGRRHLKPTAVPSKFKKSRSTTLAGVALTERVEKRASLLVCNHREDIHTEIGAEVVVQSKFSERCTATQTVASMSFDPIDSSP